MQSQKAQRAPTLPTGPTPSADWASKRDIYPYQHDTKLDFNYWISHNDGLDAASIASLIASILDRSKADILDQVHNVDKIVIVAVHQLDHTLLRANLAAYPFLSACSSVPILAVQRDSIPPAGDKQYNWFYNDVKALNALVLWPSIPRRLFQHEKRTKLSLPELLQEHALTIQCGEDFVALEVDAGALQQVRVIVAAVKESCIAAYDRFPDSLKSISAQEHEAAVCGRCQRHRSADSGYFVLADSHMMLFWDRGETQELRVEGSTLRTVSGPSAKEWLLHSSVPRSCLRPIAHSSSSSAVADESEGSCAINRAGSLESEVQQLAARGFDFGPLVLSRDLLVALGYLTSPEHTRCCDTSSSSWALVRQAHASSERVISVLEDGEEMEEDLAGASFDSAPSSASAIPGSGPLGKLAAQARKFFLPLPAGVSLPLDVCAMDCEMCSTRLGLELTRVTVVHPVHGLVFDTLVRPPTDIVDYHTEFSGITQELLAPITVTLDDAQLALRHLIGAETIVIGHSLDCDLRAVQLVHTRVIDTSALFPHPSGLPYKHALKHLTSSYLRLEIQDGQAGHDSAQDAFAALALALWKAQEPQGGVVFSERPTGVTPRQRLQHTKYPLFDHCLRSTGLESLQLAIVTSKLLGQRAMWESDGLGYGVDCSALGALAATRSTCELSARLDVSVTECEHWREVMGALQQHAQDTTRLVWADFSLLPGATVASHQNDEAPPSKRARKQNNEVSDPQALLAALDDELGLLQAQLPPRSALLVLTQDSIIPLRLQVAKKMRNKWLQNRKGSRIPLPGEKDGRLSVDWNGAEDEPLLLQAADRAAKGCLFVKIKP